MLKLVFKKMFWCNYDNLFPNILLSAVWFGLNLPVFVFLYLLIGSHVYSPWPYVIIWNFLWISPLTAGLHHATLPMVNSEPSEGRIKLFFKGIRKFGLRSLAIFLISTAFLLIVTRVFLFYARDARGLPEFVRFIVAGIVVWVALYFVLMEMNFYPVLAKQDENIWKVFYKSFLLVLDRPGRQILFAVVVAGMFVIMTFSIFGLILFFSSFYALSSNIRTLVQLSRHNPKIVVEEENRTFRNLLKPWE